MTSWGNLTKNLAIIGECLCSVAVMEDIVATGCCEVMVCLYLGEKLVRSSPSPSCVTSVRSTSAYQ